MRQPRRWTKVDDDGGVGSGHARDREVAEMVEGHRAEEGEGDVDDGGNNEHVDKRGPRRDGRQRRSRRDDNNDDGEGWIACHLTDNGDEWCKDDVGDDSLSSFSSWASTICHGYYSFQFNRFFWGISPAGGGIHPSARGINLDFCLCTIPTVGFYGKIGEITATHH